MHASYKKRRRRFIWHSSSMLVCFFIFAPLRSSLANSPNHTIYMFIYLSTIHSIILSLYFYKLLQTHQIRPTNISSFFQFQLLYFNSLYIWRVVILTVKIHTKKWFEQQNKSQKLFVLRMPQHLITPMRQARPSPSAKS